MLVGSLLVALALAIGDAARARLGIRSGLAERVAFAGGLGLAIVSTLGFALAAIGWFRPVPLLAAAAVLVFVAIAARDREPLRIAPMARSEVPLVLAIAVPIAATLPFLPAPEIAFDSVYYHLPIARDLARLGTLPYEPYLIFSAFPLLADLLFGVCAALGAPDGARMVQFAAGLLAACAAAALGSRLAGRRAGPLAAFVFVATPLVLWEMTIAYVDLVAALFVALSSLRVLRWLDSAAPKDAALGGAFLGFGLATKLTVGLVALPLLLGVLALALRARRGAGAAAIALLTMTLAAAPHYLRALILTGNPVFPYLNGLFHSPLWEPVNDTFDHLQFGAGRGPLDLAVLPLRLVVEPGRFDQNPLPYLALFPLVVAAATILALRPGAPQPARVVAAVVAGATLLWFGYGQYARYLLPAYPLGAALAGGLAAPLVAGDAGRLARVASRALVVVACLAAVPLLLLPYRTVLEPLPLRYDIGLESRDEYLTRAFRHYAMYRWLSTTLDPDAMVLGVAFSEAPIVYSDLPIYRAETTLAGRRVLAAGDAAAALAAIRAERFAYVLLDRAPRASDPSGGHVAATERFATDNLRLVHEEGPLALYAVPPP